MLLLDDIIVGCPINNRAWIMPTWFKYVTVALAKAGFQQPKFIFVGSEDDDSLDFLAEADAIFETMTICVDEPPVTERVWNVDRFAHMVFLRNELLEQVRRFYPRYFWSLDSDILPHEDALVEALRWSNAYDAVGMHTYMSRPLRPVRGAVLPYHFGREYTSKGDLVNGVIQNRTHYESQQGQTYQTGVIMGSKLMSPSAYCVDYRVHPEGEDAGWAVACAEEGLKLGWCSTALCKHVMHASDLNHVDARVGF